MEEEIARQRRQPPSPAPPPAITTTAAATTPTRLSAKDSGTQFDTKTKEREETFSGDGTMGGNRSGSTSSSVGWMGGGEGGVGHVKTPQTPPRQPSKRDSGYHTDCSPATFSSHHQFTFDPHPDATTTSPLYPAGGHHEGQQQPWPIRRGSTSTGYSSSGTSISSASAAAPLSSSLPSSSTSLLTSLASLSTLSSPSPTSRLSLLALSPGGWQPSRLLPDVDSDDEGDDDAFVSDHVMMGDAGAMSDLYALPPESARPRTRSLATERPESEMDDASARSARRRRSLQVVCSGGREDAAQNVEDREERLEAGESMTASGCDTERLAACASPLRGEENEAERADGGGAGDRKGWRLSTGSNNSGGSLSRATSPRNVRFQSVMREAPEDTDDDDDDDDDADQRRQGGDDDHDGVSSTDYHHAPLSLLRLPGGERLRPLLARTIATQTPHLHCQLIDHILACPQGLPQCARGSAVRRLRYYSEGEETVGVSSLTPGPLPDIVPVSQAHRERSLSAPDLDAIQRQRVAAREVGRELRRISDEFVRSHEALRGNPNGALAALHAELNGVAALFLTGVRRLLYRDFAGYFRHVFYWTRQQLAAHLHHDDRPTQHGSSVDLDDPR